MSAAEHLQEAIDAGCTRDDHDHVADHRAEVLAEAAGIGESVIAKVPVTDEHLAFWWKDGARTYRDELLAMAGKDTGGAHQAPAGESTQPAPGDLTPLAVRWDRLVMHPAGDDPNTVVCCIAADTGQPVALFLDDEHREALGLQLVDPDGDDEVYADVPDDEGDTAPAEQPASDQCSCMPHRKFPCGHCEMDVCQDCGQCCFCTCDQESNNGDHADDPFEADLDGWVRCGRPRCPNAERFGKAAERGWGTHPVNIWLCPDHAEQPTPGFFRPGRTYVRQHHGSPIPFLVSHIATAPGATYPTAFGWRHLGGDWEPTDSDDMDGWAEQAEGEVSRG